MYLHFIGKELNLFLSSSYFPFLKNSSNLFRNNLIINDLKVETESGSLQNILYNKIMKTRQSVLVVVVLIASAEGILGVGIRSLEERSGVPLGVHRTVSVARWDDVDR